MTLPVDRPVVSTADLQPRLEDMLARYFDSPRPIDRLERRPSEYGSSYALEDLDLLFADGTRLQLVFKDLSRQSMLEEGKRAKPVFLYDPLREIQVYRDLLRADTHGTPTCYGTVVEPAHDRFWLFLERIEGVELSQIGDLATWRKAAIWLAELHGAFQTRSDLAHLARTAHLILYGPNYYRLWPKRVQTFLFGALSNLAKPERRRLERLLANYGRVIERLGELPMTIIHGEFFSSNVLVRSEPGSRLICPLDWEMAALGPGPIDLAALSAGGWSDEQRRALAQAYYTALTPGTWPGLEALLDALDYCHLHLAIQWLGWSDVWSPPPRQANDWLAEALLLAERLGL